MDTFTLLLLACPVVMGAMMWMMMRPSSKSQDSGRDAAGMIRCLPAVPDGNRNVKVVQAARKVQ